MEEHNFGWALKQLEAGEKVAREGWNGMFLFLIVEWEFVTDVEGVESYQTLPFICMKTADNKLIPWLASQGDMLASDWESVE